jgi:5-methylcytosine-specific restriction endonuclease McrA
LSLDDPDRSIIMERFRYRCLRCGRIAVTIHEIEPKSHGREKAMLIENRIPLCNDCHLWVHGHNTQEVRTMLRKLREDYAAT